MEWAPRAGRFERNKLTGGAGLSKDGSHGKTPITQRRVQASGRAGVSGRRDLHGLAKRHDISRNLVRVWVEKYEAGAFDDAQAADMIQHTRHGLLRASAWSASRRSSSSF